MSNGAGVALPLKPKSTVCDVAAGVPAGVEPSSTALNFTFAKPLFEVGTYRMPRVESTLTWPVAGTVVRTTAPMVFGVPEGLGTRKTPACESLTYAFPLESVATAVTFARFGSIRTITGLVSEGTFVDPAGTM